MSSRLANLRVGVLLECMGMLNVDVANVDDKHTHSRINVTFWSPSPNNSEHLTIRYNVEYGGRRAHSRVLDIHRGWLTSRFDKAAFVQRSLSRNPLVRVYHTQYQGDFCPGTDVYQCTGGVWTSRDVWH